MEATPPQPTVSGPTPGQDEGRPGGLNGVHGQRVGKQFGNYRLLRLLAEGGHAEVYLGEHVYLGTQAAIKILYARLLSEELQQFRTEARLLARLRHSHIISILDFDVEEDIPFLVMDYAPAGTIRQRHPRGSILPPGTILSYLKQIADALQYAHDKRLIHRDVKPENLLIGWNEEILLSDFGIAVLVGTSRAQALQEAIGTLPYMAPEQIQGKARPASDQYSLGIILYEWLCGNYPFHGSIAEIMAQHINATPPPLREKNPQIAAEIEAVVCRALAKDPAKRYPTVYDLYRAFERACSEHTLLLRADGAVEQNGLPAIDHDIEMTELAPLPALAPTMPARPALAKEKMSRRKVLLGLAALTSVGLTGSGLTWLVRTHHLPGFISRKPPAPSPAPTATSQPSPTPTVAIGTTIHTYRGHTDWVLCLSWSPDNRTIASGGKDTTVQVWDSATGGVSAYAYSGHSDAINGVAFSPDGSHVASASNDKTVQVWNAGDGSNAFTYSGHSDAVKAVAWSPDGNSIASASADKTVQVWDSTNGTTTLTFSGHSGAVNAVAWSPSPQLAALASGSDDGTVQVWSATDASVIYNYTQHTDAVKAVAWSPNGNSIASASADKTVQVWDATTGAQLSTFSGHSDVVNSTAWSPDGSLIASASDDGTVHIWNPANGRDIFTYQGHSSGVKVAAWSTDGVYIASGSADKTVQIWQAS